MEQLIHYLKKHPEQQFLLKASILIVLLLMLQSWAARNLNFLFFPMLFGPAFILMFLHLTDHEQRKGVTRRFLENISIAPVPVPEGEWKQTGHCTTTSLLIATNVILFYTLEHSLPFLVNDPLNLLQQVPTFLTVLVSPLAAMFLHLSSAHLWGNMFFLWGFGSVVERRVGWKLFIATYLLSGLISSLAYMDLASWTTGHFPDYPGASGAVAGIIGLYAIRCYFKTILVPLPLLGLLSFFWPLYYQVRMNALVLIGLMFALDPQGGMNPLTPGRNNGMAHWADLFGLGIGIAVAYRYKLHRAAVTEKHLEKGLQPWHSGYGLDQKREDLQAAVKGNPDEHRARLELAETLFASGEHDAARQHYRDVIEEALASDPQAAMMYYHEYYRHLLGMLSPAKQFRLASLYDQQGDHVMAECCLTLLVEDSNTPDALREKAMYQQTLLMERAGDISATRCYLQQFLDNHPDSDLAAKAQNRLQRLQVHP